MPRRFAKSDLRLKRFTIAVSRKSAAITSLEGSHEDRADDLLLPLGTHIDLDNCAREPIHIPGSIQPRGVLAVVCQETFVVRQVSSNVEDLLGKSVVNVVGHHLSNLIGDDQAHQIERALLSQDEGLTNPTELLLNVGGRLREFDAILHCDADGVLLVELEIAYGKRPYSFPNTYRAVRATVEELNQGGSLTDLYDITARAVRTLTGFDRVMVYRYDSDYNGEVVAEAKRHDLNPFLGLHYPASDIPAQARALYEKNWLRLISDVGYTPAPLVPSIDPERGAPQDLTHATLRSVSPIHIEYLKNMGIRASMSISLLRRGKLWGLIACHHYSGPHLPPYGTRAAAEFLGSTLSLRLVERAEADQLQARVAAQDVLAKLGAAILEERDSLASVLSKTDELFELVPADGVAVHIGGERHVEGLVPDPDALEAIVKWAQRVDSDTASTDCLFDELPTLDCDPQIAAGVLVLSLPDGQYIVWFRSQVLRSVTWGGDPHNKAIAVREGDKVRISPRKSFELWQEIVHKRSLPWTAGQIESAEMLRRQLVESLYRRAQAALRVAETLQRSLLPASIPTLENWHLSAHYAPAEGDRVGGDWYDAFELRDGRLVVLLGDVAGHGLIAAGTMAQLRNVLRGHLFAGASLVGALAALNEFCWHMLPKAFATVIVALVDLDSGHVEAASAGHLMPFLTSPDGLAVHAPISLSPPIGVRGAAYTASTFTMDPLHWMVMYSDGLVERRGKSIDDGFGRLAALLDSANGAPASEIWRELAPRNAEDDIAIVTLQRL